MDMEIESKETTEQLPCTLTNTELLSVSRDLAQAHQDIEATKNRKAEFNSQISADLKKKAADVESLSLKISTGKEFRPVKCVWEYNWEAGKKKLRRLDTEEAVRVVEITEQERQESMI